MKRPQKLERRGSRYAAKPAASAPMTRLDLFRGRRRQPLVGVEREHPVAGRKIERAILLRAESGPVGGNDDLGA